MLYIMDYQMYFYFYLINLIKFFLIKIIYLIIIPSII